MNRWEYIHLLWLIFCGGVFWGDSEDRRIIAEAVSSALPHIERKTELQLAELQAKIASRKAARQ